MKERPILFSGPMVRAILEGRKVQTRRVMKQQPLDHFIPEVGPYHPIIVKRGLEEPGPELFGAYDDIQSFKSPYGQPNDQLWIRETTYSEPMKNILTGEDTQAIVGKYTADNEDVVNEDGFNLSWWYSKKSCPSIHMPRWASRIQLEITKIRVERLQDISEHDAMAEGVETNTPGVIDGEWIHYGRGLDDFPAYSALESFESLWDSINAKREKGAYAWAKNPWVWVIEFKQIKKGA